MHAIFRVFLWLAIIIGLTLIAHYTKQEVSPFRLAVALTWLVWVFIGIMWAVRGSWRFLRS